MRFSTSWRLSLADVRRSTDADRAPIVDIWVAAFAADPVIRWFLPDEGSYVAKAREVFLKSGSGKRFIRRQLSHYFSSK